ncbi:hypothetical protein, partial [Pseudomonas amygdali]
MGLLKCILIRMTSFGFGLRLRCSYSVPVVRLFLSFVFFLFASNSYAAIVYIGPYTGASYSSGIQACIGDGAAAGVDVNPRYAYGRTYDCGNGWSVAGGGSCSADETFDSVSGQCITTPVVTPAPDAPSTDQQKCLDAKGTTRKSHSWHQSTDTPMPPSPYGCATTLSGVSICLADPAGGFTCTGDITVTGELYVAPAPTPDPTTPTTDPTTPGTGTGSGSG